MGSLKLKSKRWVWKLSTSRYKYQVFLALGLGNRSLRRDRRPMEDKRTIYFFAPLNVEKPKGRSSKWEGGGV